MSYSYSSPNFPVTLHPSICGNETGWWQSTVQTPFRVTNPCRLSNTTLLYWYSSPRQLKQLTRIQNYEASRYVNFSVLFTPAFTWRTPIYCHDQGYTNFPKIQEPSLHSWRQGDDTNQVPYSEPKKIICATVKYLIATVTGARRFVHPWTRYWPAVQKLWTVFPWRWKHQDASTRRKLLARHVTSQNTQYFKVWVKLRFYTF